MCNAYKHAGGQIFRTVGCVLWRKIPTMKDKVATLRISFTIFVYFYEFNIASFMIKYGRMRNGPTILHPARALHAFSFDILKWNKIKFCEFTLYCIWESVRK